MDKAGAIVLAAGKGTRLNSTTKNKVMLKVGDEPMLGRTIQILSEVGFEPIIVVVGFGRESIIKYLGDSVRYAVQDKQLGTAHAAKYGLSALPKDITDVLIVYGDDSYCYPTKLLSRLVKLHKKKKADLTMLTVEKANPYGLGRIIRDESDKVIGIVEEKNATAKQRKITEINTGCYIFDRDFIEEFLSKVKKNNISGEYYLTDLVALAVRNGKRLEAVRGNKIPWRGVNTSGELKEARRVVAQLGN